MHFEYRDTGESHSHTQTLTHVSNTLTHGSGDTEFEQNEYTHALVLLELRVVRVILLLIKSFGINWLGGWRFRQRATYTRIDAEKMVRMI